MEYKGNLTFIAFTEDYEIAKLIRDKVGAKVTDFRIKEVLGHKRNGIGFVVKNGEYLGYTDMVFLRKNEPYKNFFQIDGYEYIYGEEIVKF